MHGDTDSKAHQVDFDERRASKLFIGVAGVYATSTFAELDKDILNLYAITCWHWRGWYLLPAMKAHTRQVDCRQLQCPSLSSASCEHDGPMPSTLRRGCR
jgi:hypothetical protein